MVTYRVAKAAEGGPKGWVVERVEKGTAPVVVGVLYKSATAALEDANRLNAEHAAKRDMRPSVRERSRA